MRLPSWLSRFAWLLAPLLALAFLLWVNAARIQRIQNLSNLAGWSLDPAVVDPHSPTGYADGFRQLILPEHNNDSYQWIVQTQHMLAAREWRLRHVDYDNAPVGREVNLPSVYRWWLGFVAWCDHTLSGRSLGQSVEQGALWADPLLQVLLWLGATVYTARNFGRFAASLVALGSVLLFPLGGSFPAGAPDRHALALLCAVWSVLPIVGGLRALHGAPSRQAIANPGTAMTASHTRAGISFSLAAVAGALGLWADVHAQWPVLLGIVCGAAVAAWMTRGSPADAETQPPWRLWGLCGCAASLLFYAAEYFPHHVLSAVETNNPVFALSWLGAGELLTRLTNSFQHRSQWKTPREMAGWLFALALTATTPVAAVWAKNWSWLADDPLATQLTAVRGGIAEKSLADWLGREGLNPAVWATCLPILLIAAMAVARIFRRTESLATRTGIALALGSLLAVAPIACLQLRIWSTVDALLLVLVACLAPQTAATRSNRLSTLWWTVGAAVVFAFGLVQLSPETKGGSEMTVSETELHGLIERDLSQWLAKRAGKPDAIVLAPPDLTTSAYFHGGLRGVGTFHPENRDGVSAAVRIASAMSVEEAWQLCSSRGITHILVPSWDTFLDDYIRLGTSMPEKSFLTMLHHWALPNWIRPVPYYIPSITGIEGQSVAVFEVVDEQNPAAAAIVLAEYFIETGNIELAASLRSRLRRYPSVMAASIALAEIEFARGDGAAFAAALDTIVPVLSAGGDRALPWNSRVRLAIILSQGKKPDLAREQIRRCLAQIDDTRVRALTTEALFRFQVLCRAFGMEIGSPEVRTLALKLLPPELRSRLK